MQCAAISRSFEQAEPVQELRRRQPAARLHGLDLVGQLRQMGMHVAAMRLGELPDLAQQIVRAGVGRVRRPIAADASRVVAVPARDQLGILLQARLADGGDVFIAARGDRAGIGVVHAPGDHRAQAELGRGARQGRGIAIEVDHRGAAGAQQLVQAEARQRMGVLLAEPVALRDARRVHRRQPDILDHAAGDHERRVVVHVDQARHRDAAAGVEGRRRRPAPAESVGRADIDDGAVDDRDGAGLDGAVLAVEGQDQRAADQQVAGCWIVAHVWRPVRARTMPRDCPSAAPPRPPAP